MQARIGGSPGDHPGLVLRDLVEARPQLAEVFPDAPAAAGNPTESLITFVKDRLGHDWRYAIDGTKIRTELGWSPAETLESGLRKTVEWYLGNSKWRDAVEAGAGGERLGLG